MALHHSAQAVPYEYRKRRREVEDVGGEIVGKLAVLPDQDEQTDFNDVRSALA